MKKNQNAQATESLKSPGKQPPTTKNTEPAKTNEKTNTKGPSQTQTLPDPKNARASTANDKNRTANNKPEPVLANQKSPSPVRTGSPKVRNELNKQPVEETKTQNQPNGRQQNTRGKQPEPAPTSKNAQPDSRANPRDRKGQSPEAAIPEPVDPKAKGRTQQRGKEQPAPQNAAQTKQQQQDPRKQASPQRNVTGKQQEIPVDPKNKGIQSPNRRVEETKQADPRSKNSQPTNTKQATSPARGGKVQEQPQPVETDPRRRNAPQGRNAKAQEQAPVQEDPKQRGKTADPRQVGRGKQTLIPVEEPKPEPNSRIRNVKSAQREPPKQEPEPVQTGNRQNRGGARGANRPETAKNEPASKKPVEQPQAQGQRGQATTGRQSGPSGPSGPAGRRPEDPKKNQKAPEPVVEDPKKKGKQSPLKQPAADDKKFGPAQGKGKPEDNAATNKWKNKPEPKAEEPAEDNRPGRKSIQPYRKPGTAMPNAPEKLKEEALLRAKSAENKENLNVEANQAIPELPEKEQAEVRESASSRRERLKEKKDNRKKMLNERNKKPKTPERKTLASPRMTPASNQMSMDFENLFRTVRIENMITSHPENPDSSKLMEAMTLFSEANEEKVTQSKSEKRIRTSQVLTSEKLAAAAEYTYRYKAKKQAQQEETEFDDSARLEALKSVLNKSTKAVKKEEVDKPKTEAPKDPKAEENYKYVSAHEHPEELLKNSQNLRIVNQKYIVFEGDISVIEKKEEDSVEISLNLGQNQEDKRVETTA